MKASLTRQLPERWWHGLPSERFWLKTTSRDRIGDTVEGWVYDQSGQRRNPACLLARDEIVPGDIVFHLDQEKDAIVACSTVGGRCRHDEDAYWETPLRDTRLVGPAVRVS